MQFGMQMIFQSFGYGPDMTDAKVYDEEIKLAILADQVGFNHLWVVEHHFDDYSFCPDNTVFLANMAGRTKRIRLGTGAVIVPWNDPLRVAEKIAMLDLISGGRVIFGMGRGLSRIEYAPFRIDMTTSRERFDEAAPMIINALETGFIEGDGKYYPQPRTEIRPRPQKTFKGRTFSVTMSPDSVLSAARLGIAQNLFTQGPWEQYKHMIDSHRAEYVKHHAGPLPKPQTCDFVVCDEDRARGEDNLRQYLTTYIASLMGHYELAGEHFKGKKGYESYGETVDILKQLGFDGMAKDYMAGLIWGTPDECIEKIRARRQVIGEFDLNCCIRYGGIPYEVAERTTRLFGEKVIPIANEQEAQEARRAAE